MRIIINEEINSKKAICKAKISDSTIGNYVCNKCKSKILISKEEINLIKRGKPNAISILYFIYNLIYIGIPLYMFICTKLKNILLWMGLFLVLFPTFVLYADIRLFNKYDKRTYQFYLLFTGKLNILDKFTQISFLINFIIQIIGLFLLLIFLFTRIY